jgi:putative spermidine/putrescine transport system substrate-binding protein
MRSSMKMQRRQAIGGLVATLAMPFVTRGARAAEKLVICTPGGVYDDVIRRSNVDAFTKATGVEVQLIGTTMAKVMAMYQAGGAPFDVIAMGDAITVPLERAGVLTPIQYDTWQYTDKTQIPANLLNEMRVSNYSYATVNAYNTDSFGKKGPHDWAEFWDTKAFPGPRTLPDMVTGQPPLEFALIADGVPVDKLYPLDIERAFRGLTRIRGAVPKFWDSGALSAQMLSDKEATLAALWNGRVQVLIEKGAPLTIEWNQAMVNSSCLSISKTASNPVAAQKYVDFAMQPTSQLGFAKDFRYGPTNVKAYDLLPRELWDVLPGSPRLREMSFAQDPIWWADNRERVNKTWSSWIFD